MPAIAAVAPLFAAVRPPLNVWTVLVTLAVLALAVFLLVVAVTFPEREAPRR